jgi:putative membrane protein
MWPFVLLVALVIGLVVLFLGKTAEKDEQKGGAEDGQETPLDVLKKRYARGEIDDEEFEHKKQKLKE